VNTDIPISYAKKLCDDLDLDQVVIIGRKTGDDGYEAVTTYGKDAIHCEVASNTGDFLKYKIMKWQEDT